MAGFNIRLFAHQYPNDVAGLVLVDASHEDLWSRWEALRTPAEWSWFQEKMEDFFRDVSDGVLAEWSHFDQNMATIRGVGLPSDVPIAILTSTRVDEVSDSLGITAADIDAKLDLHRQWLMQAPQAMHTLTEASGHYIQDEEPDLVIDAIREVLGRARNQQRS
jgi:pimeloyl-ACP methyl ester carboxylesterase